MAAYGAATCPDKVVSIGPLTTCHPRSSSDLHVDAEADPHDIDGLVAAIVALVEEP